MLWLQLLLVFASTTFVDCSLDVHVNLMGSDHHDLDYIWSSSSVSCRCKAGDYLDWFAGYKLPRFNKNSHQQHRFGDQYLVLEPGKTWSMSPESVNATTGHPLAETLKQIYDDNLKSHTTVRLLYNDEFPNGTVTFNLGHSKGVLFCDKETCFWLVHSIPKFPPSASYVYPHTGYRYGQSLLCVTFDIGQLRTVSKQLLLNQPYVYSSYLSSEIRQKYPDLVNVEQGRFEGIPPFYRETLLSSRSGLKFHSFAKQGKWGKELYADLVAPSLASDLFVESWMNGPGDIPSTCPRNGRRVYNVQGVQFAQQSLEFDNHDDHSKWAVSTGGSAANWTCIGDINRQEHQRQRGGGTLCSRDPTLYEAFRQIVKKFEHCHA